MIGHWWPYERKWLSPPPPKRKLGSPIQKVPKKFSQPELQGTKKNFSPHKKIYLWMGGRVYTMENKDVNIDYQKVVGLGDQKWEIVEITIGIICLFEIRTIIFYIASFQVPSGNNHPQLKCQFRPDLNSQFDLSPSFINLMKNGSTSPSSPRRVANYEDVQDANA